MHAARHLTLRRLIALLMLCALPLHAYALHCTTHCALAKAMMQIDMPGHDCDSGEDSGGRSALCAAAQTLAITPSSFPSLPVGFTDAPTPHDPTLRSHIPSPPERPPRPS